MLRDVFRLRRRLQKIKKEKSPDKSLLDKLSEDIEQSIAIASERQKNRPQIT